MRHNAPDHRGGITHNQLFESALAIGTPWSVELDWPAKRLVVLIDFILGTRFALPGHDGMHSVYDTITKEYHHLNFFPHQRHLRVRTPRVRLPDKDLEVSFSSPGPPSNPLEP